MSMDFFLSRLTNVAYWALVAYVVCAGWQRSHRQEIGLIWFLTLPCFLFVGLRYGGFGPWTHFPYWSLINETYALVPPAYWSSAFCALFIALFIFCRLAWGRAGPRYRVVVLWGSIALFGLFAADLGYQFTLPIRGWSATGAAQNICANADCIKFAYFDPSASPIPRIIEEPFPQEYSGPENARRFVLYCGQQRVSAIYLTPYGWFWWQIYESESLFPGFTFFSLAEKEWNTNSTDARAALESIVRDYPHSNAALRAQDLLYELESQRPMADSPANN
jgi:hypothetical protein